MKMVQHKFPSVNVYKSFSMSGRPTSRHLVKNRNAEELFGRGSIIKFIKIVHESKTITVIHENFSSIDSAIHQVV